MQGYFGINLHFYNRDADVSKIAVHTFDCKEIDMDMEEDGQEELKEGEARQAKQALMNRAGGGKDLAQLFIEMSLQQ